MYLGRTVDKCCLNSCLDFPNTARDGNEDRSWNKSAFTTRRK